MSKQVRAVTASVQALQQYAAPVAPAPCRCGVPTQAVRTLALLRSRLQAVGSWQQRAGGGRGQPAMLFGECGCGGVHEPAARTDLPSAATLPLPLHPAAAAAPGDTKDGWFHAPSCQHAAAAMLRQVCCCCCTRAQPAAAQACLAAGRCRCLDSPPCPWRSGGDGGAPGPARRVAGAPGRLAAAGGAQLAGGRLQGPAREPAAQGADGAHRCAGARVRPHHRGSGGRRARSVRPAAGCGRGEAAEAAAAVAASHRLSQGAGGQGRAGGEGRCTETGMGCGRRGGGWAIPATLAAPRRSKLRSTRC